MTNEQKLNLTKDRYNRLKESPKDLKCGGVLRKIRRQLRNMESSKL